MGEVLERPDFQRLAALRSHREALEDQLARTRLLLETIDHTIDHLVGRNLMTDGQMFAGFTVAAGDDRFGERADSAASQTTARWPRRGGGPATVIEVYQPAGRLEQFFREVGQYQHRQLHAALSVDGMVRLFDAYENVATEECIPRCRLALVVQPLVRWPHTPCEDTGSRRKREAESPLTPGKGVGPRGR